MGFFILIVGVALWWAAHLFKRVAPARRAAMGDGGRGAVAGAVFLSILLMVIGYKMTGDVFVWAPPTSMMHANNMLILIAIWMMSPAGQKGRILNRVRHPMQIGFGLWAFAHLMVNGDLASIVLFGGLLAWVPVQMAVINHAAPGWMPPPRGSIGKDGMFLVASVVLLLVIGYVHGLIGPSPFPG
jgi:uncharacterized membrane protein